MANNYVLECELTDNLYWSGSGHLSTVIDVDSTTDCCKLCKEDDDCTNFSHGKVGHGYAKECTLKKGGDEYSMGDFISSPKDISRCACTTGRHHTSL